MFRYPNLNSGLKINNAFLRTLLEQMIPPEIPTLPPRLKSSFGDSLTISCSPNSSLWIAIPIGIPLLNENELSHLRKPM